MDGQVKVTPMPAGQPAAEFTLSGADLTGDGFSIARARLGGRLRWPLLNLEIAETEFADASTLGGTGEIDLQSRQVSKGSWHFHGGRARWFLPPGMAYSNLLATGQIRGSPGAWSHSGELTAEGFSAPHLKPCRVLASWRGENLTFPEANIKLALGVEALDLAGVVRVGGPGDPSWAIEMNAMTLTRDAAAHWRLDEPCRIFLVRQTSAPDRSAPSTWQVKAEGIHWVGQGRELTLDGDVVWPARGRVEVRGRGLSLADTPGFIDLPVERASLHAIDLKANWEGGPMAFELFLKGEAPALEDETFSAEIKLTGDANGLVADPVIVSAQGAEILHAQGKFPLTLTPEREQVRVRLEESKPLNLQLATAPNKQFWDFVGSRFGVQIVDPKVEANLQGTLREVRGTLLAQADQIGRAQSTNNVVLPTMERLRLDARLEGDKVRLSEFAFVIENQPVRVTGDLPIRQNPLLAFVSNGALPDWRQARARIEIADARIESFARYLPKVLGLQGRLSVNLDVVPGGELNGELEISGAATRPLTLITPIRDIQAKVQFSGRRAAISQFTGRMGGREVTLTGNFDLPDLSEPQFSLRLRGDNVPLIYRPGLLLRSDLDFQFTRAIGQPATVSGNVTLRDGLYLQDLKALVPTGRAEPMGRPPYFSVTEKPFADCKLNINVHGDRFMRVRTPYFHGEVSADFQIKGDLKEPQALGELRINSGLVRFPFGTLSLEQGNASLTSE